MISPQETHPGSLTAQSHFSCVAIKIIGSLGREQWARCIAQRLHAELEERWSCSAGCQPRCPTGGLEVPEAPLPPSLLYLGGGFFMPNLSRIATSEL